MATFYGNKGIMSSYQAGHTPDDIFCWKCVKTGFSTSVHFLPAVACRLCRTFTIVANRKVSAESFDNTYSSLPIVHCQLYIRSTSSFSSSTRLPLSWRFSYWLYEVFPPSKPFHSILLPVTSFLLSLLRFLLQYM